MRTRVKICGITRVEDAVRAVALGVDALGLVFYSGSARAVSPESAVKIIAATAPFVTIVGLFLNADTPYVKNIMDSVRLDLLQFHGTETPQECAAHRKPFIKAVPMSGSVDVQEYMAAYPEAAGFLFDSHSPGKRGGLGRCFDWKRIPGDLGKPLILAGGLTPQNVGDAIRGTKPYAVDVSSGVEANKGSKDPAKMAAFMREVHRVDCSTN
jgi:phosphoribosylanthranilate isomerase